MLGDLHFQGGAGALQPCGPPGHQGAGRADRQSHDRLDRPKLAPVVVEQAQEADDGQWAGRAQRRRQGEVEAQHRGLPPEQGGQHMVCGDEGHHLIADTGEGRAEEVHRQVVNQAKHRKTSGDAAGAEQQGGAHAEPPDQDRGDVRRSADADADHGEAHSGLGPVPGLVVDHQRQGDAERGVDADVDQGLQETEHSQHGPRAPLDPIHRWLHGYGVHMPFELLTGASTRPSKAAYHRERLAEPGTPEHT